VNNGICVCGSKAHFFSKITLPEMLLLRLGWYKPADMSALNLSNKPLGGHSESVKAAWEDSQPANGEQNDAVHSESNEVREEGSRKET